MATLTQTTTETETGTATSTATTMLPSTPLSSSLSLSLFLSLFRLFFNVLKSSVDSALSVVKSAFNRSHNTVANTDTINTNNDSACASDSDCINIDNNTSAGTIVASTATAAGVPSELLLIIASFIEDWDAFDALCHVSVHYRYTLSCQRAFAPWCMYAEFVDGSSHAHVEHTDGDHSIDRPRVSVIDSLSGCLLRLYLNNLSFDVRDHKLTERALQLLACGGSGFPFLRRISLSWMNGLVSPLQPLHQALFAQLSFPRLHQMRLIGMSEDWYIALMSAVADSAPQLINMTHYRVDRTIGLQCPPLSPACQQRRGSRASAVFVC